LDAAGGPATGSGTKLTGAGAREEATGGGNSATGSLKMLRTGGGGGGGSGTSAAAGAESHWCPQLAQRNVRARPARAASGTSYSVWQAGHERRIMTPGMALLAAPRNAVVIVA